MTHSLSRLVRFSQLRGRYLTGDLRVQRANEALVKRYVGRWAKAWNGKKRVFRRVKSTDMWKTDDLSRTPEGVDYEVVIEEASETESESDADCEVLIEEASDEDFS
mgnify:CR=1 FL=1